MPVDIKAEADKLVDTLKLRVYQGRIKDEALTFGVQDSAFDSLQKQVNTWASDMRAWAEAGRTPAPENRAFSWEEWVAVGEDLNKLLSQLTKTSWDVSPFSYFKEKVVGLGGTLSRYLVYAAVGLGGVLLLYAYISRPNITIQRSIAGIGGRLRHGKRKQLKARR